ncbi:MAG: hypothetical protein HUU34_08215 [Saprospiraceae bacterium]|jgi:hypothetical protein|nr:hypothetical protein [Saprospiraceae bacterium]
MMKRTIKRKLLKAKATLSLTMSKILEVNKKRKFLPFFPNTEEKGEALQEELKVLNRLAEQQVVLIRRYENSLTSRDQWNSE